MGESEDCGILCRLTGGFLQASSPTQLHTHRASEEVPVVDKSLSKPRPWVRQGALGGGRPGALAPPRNGEGRILHTRGALAPEPLRGRGVLPGSRLQLSRTLGQLNKTFTSPQ